MDRRRAPGEADSLKMAGERVSAWWTAVIAGQADQSHPIQGTNISAKVVDGTLIVSGAVPEQEDLDEIRDEVASLTGHGVTDVRVEVEVKAHEAEQKGLLRQTLIGAFESAELAGFAAGYLEGHAHVPRAAMLLVEPHEADDRRKRQILDDLGPPYTGQVKRWLADGRSVLIVSVDELDAFRVRELLDEETRSLETLVLPPQPARPTRPTPNPKRESAASGRARRAQQAALTDEERARAR